jgi:predicted GIY-YIG superfamily endonuclease
MDVNQIKSQFTIHIKKSMKSQNPRLKYWYCGITNNTQKRKLQHHRNFPLLKHWKFIEAKNMLDANSVEAFFSKKGTSNRPSKNGANESSIYVYLFREPSLPEVKGLAFGGDIGNLIDTLFNETT